MRAVLVMFKDGERRDFVLSEPKTVIGRKADASLRIPTADVSREHCEVELAGNEIVVRDLGSSNGTYLNGKRIAEARVMAGDKISVGPVTFIVQVNGLPPKITPFDVRPAPQGPAPKAAAPAKPAAPPTRPSAPAAKAAPTTKPAAQAGKPAAEAKGSPLDDELDEILDLGAPDLDDMFDDDDDDAPPKKK